jgi:hypothetical protein
MGRITPPWEFLPFFTDEHDVQSRLVPVLKTL